MLENNSKENQMIKERIEALIKGFTHWNSRDVIVNKFDVSTLINSDRLDFFYECLALINYNFSANKLYNSMVKLQAIYKDDTNVVFKHREKALLRIENTNLHPNVIFAMYDDRNSKVSFLDLMHTENITLYNSIDLLSTHCVVSFPEKIKDIDKNKKYTILIGIPVHLLQQEVNMGICLTATSVFVNSLDIDNNNINDIFYVSI